MAGFDTTLPITLDNMIYHAASVVRGVKRALVVVDLPFGTTGNSRDPCLNKDHEETGASAVKMEGGRRNRIHRRIFPQAYLLWVTWD
jgi:3-methyl-2-oxobutanoate hydroxymethyltransferase